MFNRRRRIWKTVRLYWFPIESAGAVIQDRLRALNEEVSSPVFSYLPGVEDSEDSYELILPSTLRQPDSPGKIVENLAVPNRLTWPVPGDVETAWLVRDFLMGNKAYKRLLRQFGDQTLPNETIREMSRCQPGFSRAYLLSSHGTIPPGQPLNVTWADGSDTRSVMMGTYVFPNRAVLRIFLAKDSETFESPLLDNQPREMLRAVKVGSITRAEVAWRMTKSGFPIGRAYRI